MNLKDPRTGNPRNGGKTGKSNPPKDIVEAQDYLERFFTNKNDYDYDALNFVIGELKEILKYCQRENEHIIRGMSLFIIIDSKQ